jgi:glucose/arabinose dehydrogenase
MRHVLATLLLVVASLPAPAQAQAGPATPKSPSAEQPPRVRLEPVLTKLDKPVWLTHDGIDPSRLFVVEQTGRVFIYRDGKLDKSKPYLDLSKRVKNDYECGLLSLVFHPDFKSNGRLYVNYTALDPKLKTFISEFQTDPKADSVDLKTERVILTIDQPYPNHNGGQLQFGPDGYLYTGMGDGGNQRDPHGHGQRTDILLAKILRIDVSPRQGYGIPKDNPFVNDPKFRPEIYAYGMRNPWRFSFDRATGLLYAADVGESEWEEVDLIQKGGNYGWSAREGAHDFKPHSPDLKTFDPIFEYPHAQMAASITGGYVYHGTKLPGLVGWYVFGDYVDGRVFAIKYDRDQGRVTSHGLLIDPKDAGKTGGVRRPTQPSAFCEDAAGELYLLDVNGAIYRIEPEQDSAG